MKSPAILSTLLVAALPTVARAETAIALGYNVVSYDDGSSELTGDLTPPGLRVDVQDTDGLSLTVDYALGEHLSVALIAGTPLSVEVVGAGTAAPIGDVVSTRALSPVIGLRYHRQVAENWHLSAGAGINVTYYYDTEASEGFSAALMGATTTRIDNTVSGAIFASAAYDLSEKAFVLLQGAHIPMETTATSTTLTPVSPTESVLLTREIDVTLNPTAWSLSLGLRF